MALLTNTTVIVAEDERAVRMLVRVVLEGAGARVVEAADGAAALRLVELHPDAAVLCTDFGMPIMDGEELARASRALRPDLGVVACSALDLAVASPHLHATADRVVRKPFVPSDLVRAVHAAACHRATRTPAAAS
jgi:CheY-like chemotaxis protein